MLLHRIHLDPRSRKVRRDLADFYELHSTLCRAFSVPERKCPPGAFLWRIEPETDENGFARILVQSNSEPVWSRIEFQDWSARIDPPVPLAQRLKLETLEVGQRFRFRLRANPSVTRNGKRLGLLKPVEQEQWLSRKGDQHGFSLPKLPCFDGMEATGERIDVRISQEQVLVGRRREGAHIRVFSVLYDGVLRISDPDKFRRGLQTGIGHGKVMGLGLLSVAPLF